ncbi:MAG: glycosyltransferase family protein, partial [Planctomycetota bacterium]
LRIYGNGWEKHPTLSEFAAGPAENGDELIRVYRGSTINLQLMPAGFIHQRALDGLAAGGFFLSRMAHGDLIGPALQKLGRLMRESGQRSIAELRVLDGRVDGWLKEIRGRYYDPEKDPQSSAISLHVFVNSELATPLVDFPRFNEVVFDSAESLAERAEFFLQHDAERLEIAGAMRQVTVDRFSYDGWMAQFLNAHAEYLAGTRA